MVLSVVLGFWRSTRINSEHPVMDIPMDFLLDLEWRQNGPEDDLKAV